MILQKKHIDKLLKLYKNETWTKDRTLEDVKIMLKNCRFIALVNKNDNEIIAFARFLSDSIYRSIIYDVIVSSNLINNHLLKRRESGAMLYGT